MTWSLSLLRQATSIQCFLPLPLAGPPKLALTRQGAWYASGVELALLAAVVAVAAAAGGAAYQHPAWLIAWGEAFLTGALTAIFVAFRPQWLLTYSDERYLPPPVR